MSFPKVLHIFRNDAGLLVLPRNWNANRKPVITNNAIKIFLDRLAIFQATNNYILYVFGCSAYAVTKRGAQHCQYTWNCCHSNSAVQSAFASRALAFFTRMRTCAVTIRKFHILELEAWTTEPQPGFGPGRLGPALVPPWLGHILGLSTEVHGLVICPAPETAFFMADGRLERTGTRLLESTCILYIVLRT